MSSHIHEPLLFDSASCPSAIAYLPSSDTSTPVSEEGRAPDKILPSKPFDIALLNSIIIPDITWSPSADVLHEETEYTNSNKDIIQDIQDDDPDALRAQIDTGAFVSCTDQLQLIHGYKAFSDEYPCPVKLQPATEGSDAIPHGHGFLHVPAPNSIGYLAVRVFYHPILRTTVIDERDFLLLSRRNSLDISSETIQKHYDSGTFTYRGSHSDSDISDIIVYGILRNGKCYTRPLIAPADSREALSSPSDESPEEFVEACRRATLLSIYANQPSDFSRLREEHSISPDTTFDSYLLGHAPVLALKTEAERLLWHHRLGHPSDHYLFNAHKHVKGVPRFHHMDPVLDRCPTCIRAKQTKEPAGPNTTRTATQPYQGLSIDFSFSGTRSKNEERVKDYVGFNGETCWILVSDHFSRQKHGDTRVSKASPISWLRDFLENHAPTCDGKYVYLDQGGELYHNPEVYRLFKRFGYDVRPTGADASNQNGPVERGHLTVSNAIRALLLGASMDIKFWPYAFHHWLRIDNSLPSRDQLHSPYRIATGTIDDFSAFRTFGCRVWVRPPGRRKAKFLPNSRKGVFLGFLPNTTKNIVWYDPETNRVKTAKHARFDEGMNDLPTDLIPPNVVHLQRVQNGEALPAEAEESSIAEFAFRTNPFSHTISRSMTVQCADPTFGFKVGSDELNNRAYIESIKPRSSASRIYSTPKATNNAIRRAYFVKINGDRIFTKDDAIAALRRAFDSKIPTLDLEVAPGDHLNAKATRKVLQEHNLFRPNDIDDEDHIPALDPETIRAIAAIRHPDIDFSASMLSTDELNVALNAIRSHAITPAEQALGNLTRRKLYKLDTWPLWQAGEHKQLDHFAALGMYGKPVPKPPGAIVLRSHWQYSVKRDGTRRSRNCCDGSPRSAPTLHGVASTYSSCVEQPIQRLFFALSAQLGNKCYGGDAQDAYAHSPPPETPTFVAIDNAYAEWYKERFNVDLDRSQVLPVLHALQGHPESGRLWEEHINKILKSPELNFQHTIHDRSIYSCTFEGEKVLLLRMVDDFALSCSHEALAKKIYDIIGTKLQFATEPTPPFSYLGLVDDFNGIDVGQYSDSIVVSCGRYIDRVLRTHGWTTPSEPSSKMPTPLPVDAVTTMYQHAGHPEGTPEHAALSAKHGFSYRTLLGELLYAYITCRLDIGYAVITLSKFSTCPADIHYNLLKKVCKYLRETRDWGIIYRKTSVDSSLPPMAFLRVAAPKDLPPFPADSACLTGFLDAAHANDLRNRRSTTGYGFVLAGGAISYRCKTQSITATSSTEAEFLAAVTSAKHAKYLRAVMTELGFPQSEPTPLYSDNQSAINMINSRVPTERSRHIDIQHFAIQEWKDAGDVVMHFIPGIINPADDLTKPLGWILHARHARRLMGHY
jgi:hypothetical protein